MAHRLSFDRVLNMSAALSALLAAGAVAWSASVAAQRQSPGYSVGDTFSAPSLRLDGSPATLVMWVDSECAPCRASMPFYRSVVARPHRPRVVVMGAEPVARLRAFLTENKLVPDDVISTADQWLKFRGTPTLLLVKQDAVIANVWYGKRATASDEAAVLRELE